MSALKLKKLTVVIGGSFCFWNVGIVSVNAASLTFKNTTGRTANDFHLTYQKNNGEQETLNWFFKPPNPSGHFNPFQEITPNSLFTPPVSLTKEQFISAIWSFKQGKKEEPAYPSFIDGVPVPEPTTTFGSAICLGLGGWLKRKKSSHQNKTTSSH